MSYDVVIPTIGRPYVNAMLASLLAGEGPMPTKIFLVDDRQSTTSPLTNTVLPEMVQVLRSGGRGPAAARNVGWRASKADWIAFLDDDIVVPANWRQQLLDDLARCGESVGATQGRITVPLPGDRRPTDWERNVQGLEAAAWATADMAYRRRALTDVGGFDERFPRAYREDADLAIRVQEAGWRLVRGSRSIVHPVRPADRWVSVRLQKGNADDVLMRRIHGSQWREKGRIPKGRRRQHLLTTTAGITAVVGVLGRRRRLSLGAAMAWGIATGELAWRRIAPGPRSKEEVFSMLTTSAAIPVAASYHFLKGALKSGAAISSSWSPKPAAVLFDRDGTLVVDVPYNGDPDLVEPVAGAEEALRRLRRAGVPTAVITNQSGIAKGLIDKRQVDQVNQRLEQMIGPLGPVFMCPHSPEDRCHCRKPSPGMVIDAARALGVEPSQVVVIGDIGADMDAAKAVGARSILVPTRKTRPEEVADADEVAIDLRTAVDMAMGVKR